MATMHIDEEDAARWASKLADEGSLAKSDRAMLDAWVSAGPRRAGALLRAQAALVHVQRARILPEANIAQVPGTRPSPRRWLPGGGMLAAGIAAALILTPQGTRFSTAIGETRQVPLEDGSIATLNTQSALSVSMDATRRRAELDDGEAWFQIARDRSRPFVVEAGKVRVRAVGTAFSVRRRADAVDVLVTEGSVETWTEGSRQRPVKVATGTSIRIDQTAMAARRPVMRTNDVERTLAWRHGEITLSDDTLETAVAELNRYNRVQVKIDPAFAAVRLTGSFRTHDAVGLASTAAALVGGRVIEREGIIIIAAKSTQKVVS